MGGFEKKVVNRKEQLFSGIKGRILEIGPGTGSNLKYYPAGIDWTGLEPNPYLADVLQEELNKHHLSGQVQPDFIETFGNARAEFDCVVSTLVLCSVRDVRQSLQQIMRALKPGGKYIFLEHVAAPRGTWQRRFQRTVRPVFKCLCDNCHPDRETWVDIESCGFDKLSLDRFTLKIPNPVPHIAGIGIKAE